MLAPSFADIFFTNCFKSSVLPIVLDEKIIDSLFQRVIAQPGFTARVDLHSQTVTTSDGESYAFEVDPFRRHCLLNGLDDIGITLQQADRIKAYEARRREQAPWLFPDLAEG